MSFVRDVNFINSEDSHPSVKSSDSSVTPVYGVAQVVGYVLDVTAIYPQAGSVGGNTGTPNSFVGVDLENLTGGVVSTLGSFSESHY